MVEMSVVGNKTRPGLKLRYETRFRKALACKGFFCYNCGVRLRGGQTAAILGARFPARRGVKTSSQPPRMGLRQMKA